MPASGMFPPVRWWSGGAWKQLGCVDEAELSTGEKSSSAARSLAVLQKWRSAYSAGCAATAA